MDNDLLNLLIRRCLSDDGYLTLDEVRLIARAFCALPPELIVKENIPIFDRESVHAHEQKL